MVMIHDETHELMRARPAAQGAGYDHGIPQCAPKASVPVNVTAACTIIMAVAAIAGGRQPGPDGQLFGPHSMQRARGKNARAPDHLLMPKAFIYLTDRVVISVGHQDHCSPTRRTLHGIAQAYLIGPGEYLVIILQEAVQIVFHRVGRIDEHEVSGPSCVDRLLEVLVEDFDAGQYPAHQCEIIRR